MSSGGEGGHVHYYDAQTDKWTMLLGGGVERHTVGVSFTPEGDLRVIGQRDGEDADSDGVADYHLHLVECSQLEPYSPHHGPACASCVRA